MIHSALEHLEVFVRHYLPSGRAWDAKNIIGTNIRNLAAGLTVEFQRGDLSINDFIQEMMPDTTDEYVSRWEQAVGIPDACFTVAGDLPTRRINIQRKLSLLGLQTSADFENFATASLGLDIKARSGIDHVDAPTGYEKETPVLTIPGDFADADEARQTLVITSIVNPNHFDYEFDFPFGSAATNLMRCLFTNAKPANCNILFTTE